MKQINKGYFNINPNKTEEKHPDRKGALTIKGVKYWLSGWDNEGRDGKDPYISIRAEEAEERHQKPSTPKPEPQGDQDIPF